LNEDSAFSTFIAAQPITDLLKVRQGVRIARADQQIAQADWEKGVRAVLIGVEQLYWGWLATQRIREGAVQGLKGAEMLARMGTPEVQIALVEAKQGMQEVDNQLADIEEQLRNLLDLPPCTRIELVSPALPEIGVTCGDEVAAAAVAASPEVKSAVQDIEKARAATAAAKVDYLPNIAMVGGYANQTQMDYVQPNFAYVGFVGSYTFIDWGKRRNTIRERENLIAMAQLKVRQTEDEVRQKAMKAFREFQQDQQILQTAADMVKVRKEAVTKATTPEAMRNPTDLIAANKALGLAEVDLVKAEMNYRVAAAQIMSMMGR
jgi:outer membrane protein TolC